jgi:hypothetical protein
MSDLESCMKASSELLADFHEAWHVAMHAYQQYEEKWRAEHDDTTVANCIRSHMWKEIIRRFDGRPGCVLSSINRLKVLIYRDISVWRFKKVDGGGRHSNYETKQQRDFDNQMPLPGIPAAAVRLTSGYQPDAAGEAIERIIVARPLGKTMVWAAQVNLFERIPVWEEITPKRFAGTDHCQRKEPKWRRKQ